MISSSRERAFPLLTAISCAVCVAIFIGLNSQANHAYIALHKWGVYSLAEIYQGAWWALITSAFAHIEPLHLLFNMLWLWVLGGAFERRFGPLIWLVFVFGSAMVSSSAQLIASAGIGMSGVGYALLGFGWATRGRLPEFARIVNDQTVMMFIGWGVLCIVATQMGWMQIGNFAHGAGLIFGAAIGMAYVSTEDRVWPIATAALLSVASFVPLFYNPRSLDWTVVKAEDAFRHKRWDEAARWYKHGLELGGKPEWGWQNLALIYLNEGKEAEFERAVAELKRVDPQAAKEFEPEPGKP